MIKHFLRRLVPLIVFLSMATGAIAQTVISGKVSDATTGDPLPGVNIVVKGKVIGTITDGQGAFSLNVNDSPPITLSFSFIGFKTQELEITDANTSGVDIKLEDSGAILSDVVVTGNYVEENIMKSPVSIEKVDILTIRQNSAPDFYESVANLKGVMMNAGSINFQAMNTRGFATIANTRFMQLIDGMDASAPILNFPTGNLVGIGELDAESMELIPGSNSALWGPNAFNGTLMLNSKSPFEYQGLSAQVKVGITTSDAQGESFPLTNYGLRYAKAFNNKFAFKINFYYTLATDWKGNDYVTDRRDPESPYDLSSIPSFDGLNLYGDETVINVSGFAPLTRTGFKEEDLVDNYSANSIKGDVALHYRITDNLEAIYAYRYGGGNTVYQGSEKYAIRDFNQQFHKLELKSKNFWIRGYQTITDAGDSYNMSALGAFANETYAPSASTWVPDFLNAFNGYAPDQTYTGTVIAGDYASARAYADRNRPQPGTAAFESLIETVRNNYFQKSPPGAKFIDDSRIYHAQFNYNLSDMVKFMEVNIGGNFRRYSLFTEGTILDEDPDATSPGDVNPERINIDEYGAYAQIAKQISVLKLTGSLRYDKNVNFEGRITPRVSAVFSINDDNNIRLSYQTGFRNPDVQAQYIYFPTGSGILLGSTEANASRYGVHNGNAYNYDAFNTFRSSGGSIDPTTGALSGPAPVVTELQTNGTANIEYVKPERLQSLELGYKGVLSKKALIDFNIFYNTYNDFIGDQLIYSKEATTHQGVAVPAGSLWSPYVNATEKVTSLGTGISVTYNFFKGYTLTGNYTYQQYDADESGGFIAGFNTPNNKFTVGVSNRKISNSLPIGFNLNYRWQETYIWNSGFGNWTVPRVWCA